MRAVLLVLALVAAAAAQNAPSTIATINVNAYFSSVTTLSGNTNFLYLCQPTCDPDLTIQGITCIDWTQRANCGQDYDMQLAQYPFQLRFGDPLQPEEWGTSGIGLAAVKNYQRNSWITLEPFQMLGITHFNAPIQYSSSISGFSITLSVSVTTQPSTDNDTTLSVTTVRNFTIPYTYQETVDDCVTHGGAASAGCPWNDPFKWKNGTAISDPTCVPFNGDSNDWRLPTGESCCPFFTTQKADSPAGCSDYIVQTITMDPQYFANADGAFIIPDYVPAGNGEWNAVSQAYTLNIRGFDLQGRTSPPQLYMISDERQNTDAAVVVQFVRNCPPINNCQSRILNNDPSEDGNCTCYVDPTLIPWCPCVLEPDICHNGTCMTRTSASDPCVCDCTSVTCPGNQLILSVADNCECKCDPNRCANGASLNWNSTNCTCECIEGFCQAAYGPNFVEDEFCNCSCGINNTDCTMNGLYPTRVLQDNCVCGCSNVCTAPFLLNPVTCECECPVTQQLALTNCLLNHNIFNVDTCTCDNTQCQGDFHHPYPPLPPGPPPNPYVPPPTPPGPCTLCLIAPSACAAPSVLVNETCMCQCPGFQCTDPTKQVEINCFCKACSHDGSPDGLGYCTCGNGVVEDGEDCDGGPGGDQAECCDPLTCKWLDMCSGTDPLVDNCFTRQCLPANVTVPGRTEGTSRVCTPIPRCNQSNECFTQRCDSNTGQCIDEPNDPTITPCGAGNMCVQQCRNNRYCTFIEPDCPTPEELQATYPFPAYQCYVPECNPVNGVCTAEFQLGAPCTNGNITERLFPNGDCYASVCDAGTCSDIFLEGKTCLPGDLLGRVGPVNIQCYSGVCTQGACQPVPLFDRPCDDGFSCTVHTDSDKYSPLGSHTDLCTPSGVNDAVCTGNASPCDSIITDRNCTDVTCQESVSGYTCVQTPKPFGTPCDDGYDCTEGDICGHIVVQVGSSPVYQDTGICLGTPVVCVSNSSCIETKCDEDIGTCIYSSDVTENKYCVLDGAPTCQVTQCRNGKCVVAVDHCTVDWYNRKAAVITSSALLFLLLLAGLVAFFMICRDNRGHRSSGPPLPHQKQNLKEHLLD